MNFTTISYLSEKNLCQFEGGRGRNHVDRVLRLFFALGKKNLKSSSNDRKSIAQCTDALQKGESAFDFRFLIRRRKEKAASESAASSEEKENSAFLTGHVLGKKKGTSFGSLCLFEERRILFWLRKKEPPRFGQIKDIHGVTKKRLRDDERAYSKKKDALYHKKGGSPTIRPR